MLTTARPSSARLSTVSSMESASRPRSAVLKYLRQRIKELEQELEDKRVRLFDSEEARAELEARVEEKALEAIVLTPESSSSDSESQNESSSNEEGGLEAESGANGFAEGEHRRVFPQNSHFHFVFSTFQGSVCRNH